MEETKAPLFEGELVWLNGRIYSLPSLSVKQTRLHWDKLKELNNGITTEDYPAKITLATEVIHAALSRNYPEITLENVEDWVDMKNVRKLMMAVSGQSGLGAGQGPQPDGKNEASLTGATSTAL